MSDPMAREKQTLNDDNLTVSTNRTYPIGSNEMQMPHTLNENVPTSSWVLYGSTEDRLLGKLAKANCRSTMSLPQRAHQLLFE